MNILLFILLNFTFSFAASKKIPEPKTVYLEDDKENRIKKETIIINKKETKIIEQKQIPKK